MVKPRKAIFQDIPARIDGRTPVTMVITQDGPNGFIEVWGKGARTSYSLPISMVAEMIAWKRAKMDQL